ncbi:MAG: hypothetical protein NZ921_01120 [Candidatus Caldarchaeum sp.]|nr:hypothetical protein [Candidatus Caldarchaeum sp.]MCS7133389.1 hypothetical protein [Candidatus Caldarchaeum sp.]MCX8201956.1 hypothetical protein [Candidatus Caldarchaeum sp.]MDW8435618.1 hypothetical protein [Candidatus Caldarchaeum sp.]
MGYWVFVVKDHYIGKRMIPANEVAADRVFRKFWLISKRMAAMKSLKEGGHALLYSTGMEGRFFVGEGQFSQPPLPVTDEMRFYIVGYPSEKLTHYIKFDEATLWTTPIKADTVVDQLTFIKNKSKWFSYFRGSVRRIPDEDFLTVKNFAVSQS